MTVLPNKQQNKATPRCDGSAHQLLTCPLSSQLAFQLLCCCSQVTMHQRAGPWTDRTGNITPRRLPCHPELQTAPQAAIHLDIHSTHIQLPFYFSYKTTAKTQNLKKTTHKHSKFLFLLLLQKINNRHIFHKLVYKSTSGSLLELTGESFSLLNCGIISRSFYFINFFKHLGSSNFGKRLFVSLKILFPVIF